jgi:hypothetical protein
VAALLGFDMSLGDLDQVFSVEYSAGDTVGSVRTLRGKAGGPFEGKVLWETCVATGSGHTYALDAGKFGTPEYALPVEIEGYQGTFSVEQVGKKCLLLWCAHYTTSDPDVMNEMLNAMIPGLLLSIAQRAADVCLLNTLTDAPPNSFPRTLAGITKGWVSAALGAPVVSFGLKVCEEGQLGLTVLILDIVYEDPASAAAGSRPSTVCVKMATEGPDMRALSTSWACHSKELNVYLNMTDKIPMAMPKVSLKPPPSPPPA